jgi:hypothetical protein
MYLEKIEKGFEDTFDKIFKNINDWLKFAEQKNAGLLALNIGIIWGVSRLLEGFKITNEILYCFHVLAYGLIILSSIICIFSFLPILTNRWWLKKKEKSHDDNIFYFGDISKYNSGDYLKLIKIKYNIENYKFNGAEKDFADQIIINSKIALDRFIFYMYSSWLTVFAIIIFVVTLSIDYIGK